MERLIFCFFFEDRTLRGGWCWHRVINILDPDVVIRELGAETGSPGVVQR